MSQVDEIADELYGLVPREFTAARDEQVRAAREAGDRELAGALGKLRRPSQAAWLVNLLSRRGREQVEELLELAEAFREAHQHSDAAKLRELSTSRQRLMSALTRDARRLATEAGANPSADAIREVETTLEAGLADPAVADRIREGRLTEPASYSGFELGITPMAPAPREEAEPQNAALERARSALAAEEEATAAATRERDELSDQVERARGELDRLERKLAKAEREVEQQERRLDRARAAVERAEQ